MFQTHWNYKIIIIRIEFNRKTSFRLKLFNADIETTFSSFLFLDIFQRSKQVQFSMECMKIVAFLVIDVVKDEIKILTTYDLRKENTIFIKTLAQDLDRGLMHTLLQDIQEKK